MKILNFSRKGLWVGSTPDQRGLSQTGIAFLWTGITVWWNNSQCITVYTLRYPFAFFTYDTRRVPVAKTHGWVLK